MTLSQVQKVEFAAQDTSLEVVLQSISEQFETFRTEHPDYEYVGELCIGPVKENDQWGCSLILSYKEA